MRKSSRSLGHSFVETLEDRQLLSGSGLHSGGSTPVVTTPRVYYGVPITVPVKPVAGSGVDNSPSKSKSGGGGGGGKVIVPYYGTTTVRP